ncbi:MAG: HD domain-containing protein [Lachnospiraceae bacterium]|nr:HD domain-containing protein [Lachnospiraceae bacterium]
MIEAYYLTAFILSVLGTLIFVWRWKSDTNIYFALLFILIPISNMGFYLLAISTEINGALLANTITILGGNFLSLFIMLSIVTMYEGNISKIFTVVMFALSFILFGGALTIGHSDIYYKDAEFSIVDGVGTINKVYGPMHNIFYVVIILHAVIGIGVIIYSFKGNKGVSYKSLIFFSAIEVISLSSYLIGKGMGSNLSLMPAECVIFQIFFLSIMENTSLYNISRVQASSLIDKGENGFLSVSKKNKFIGSNNTAKEFFPELARLRVDKLFHDKNNENSIISILAGYIEGFKNNCNHNNCGDNEHTHHAHEHKNEKKHNNEKFFHEEEHILERDGKIYKILVEHLMYQKKIKGYQISIIDETKERKYTKLLQEYNQNLEHEVAEKTEHIQEIQDKMVLGLADMVENRDANTGGHIKRTSRVVSILIDEMKKDRMEGLDDEFCKCVIKAAPMHDLGKIAVDDAVLRKPGRFTPEEFEKMKTHAAKGAEIVHKVLADVEEPRFQQIAENVAHYHHERWDGSGYPEGKKGEDIPFEARIMAIADVYDALVSKRCYKESMSFEQAFNIIEEGMGTQFDERLNKYFVAARKKLEAYYTEAKEGRA